MVKIPAAQPVPRVIRSRRDDRYQAGHPAPAKRANAGYVVSQQTGTDTVTVDILDEELPGVVFLGDMPPVGAIVEVEARGDLLVIPVWYEGPPPPPSSVTVDVPAFLSDAPFSPGWAVDDISTPDTATSILVKSGASATTIASYGTGPDRFNWDVPAGATVTDVRYVVIAYREESAPVTGSPSGFYPTPTQSPFLFLDHSSRTPDPVFDLLPVGSFAGETICPFPEDINALTVGNSPYNRMWGTATDAAVHWLHVAYLAIRVTYEEP